MSDSLFSRLLSSLAGVKSSISSQGKPKAEKMRDIESLVPDIQQCKSLVDTMGPPMVGEVKYVPLFKGVPFSTQLRCRLSSSGYYSRIYNGGVLVRVGFTDHRSAEVFARLMTRRGWQCEAIFVPMDL